MMTMLAHAGHGVTDGDSLLHYLIEPAHLPFTIAGGMVVVAALAWSLGRTRQRLRKR